MGSLVPAIAGTIISQGVSIATQQSQQNQALKQLKQDQALQKKQTAQDIALEKERLSLEARTAEATRKDALKRSVARQRAQFGAQGVGSGGGSSQAVLLGLFEESENERQKREATDALRARAIDKNVAQQSALNILQRTQLAEKNKIKTLSSIGRLF